MTLDEFFGIGETVTLGAHLFGAEEIKVFAAKFDPQPFHLDEKAAQASVFGRLCASGWHSASTWMKFNVRAAAGQEAKPWTGPGTKPVFGPAAGFTNLKWPKPVYAGETITFTRKALDHRALASRPGWRMVNFLAEAFDSSGDKVLEFTSAVLVKVEGFAGPHHASP